MPAYGLRLVITETANPCASNDINGLWAIT